MSKADLDKLVAQYPAAIVSSHSNFGDDTAVVTKESLKDVMRFCVTPPGLTSWSA